MFGCFAALAGGGLLCLPALQAQSGDGFQLVAQVNAAEEQRESEVGKIVSTRRYVLRNQRWDKEAVMHVRITSSPNASKQFEILGMENAGGLQKKVFLKLLESEIEASADPSHEAETRISSENYEFAVLGTESLNGRSCVVLALKPKRSSKYLISGKAWLDVKENAVVQVEGETARSLSFWIGKPRVMQSFRKVDGIWVSAANRSVSQVRFLGKTELAVDFLQYQLARKGSGSVVARNASLQGF